MQKPHVVISLSECEEDHFLPLINLGESLKNEGADVTFLVCAHGPCPGSSNVLYDVIDYSCIGQRAKIISVLDVRGLTYKSMLNGVGDETIAASRSKLVIPAGTDYEKATYRGFNLWDIAKGSICRYLLKTNMSPDDFPVIKRFFSTAVLYIDTFPVLFSHLQPDILIIFNGMPMLDRVAREVATTFGIQVFAEENCCFADRKFLDSTGVVVNRHLFARQESWNAIRGGNLDESQSERLTKYLEEVYAGRVNTIKQCAADSRAELFNRLGFTPDRPLAILLSQVPFDSVIVNDSPVYSDIVEFIRDVMNIFANKLDWGLIVRLHPIEEKLFGNQTLKRLQERDIPENIRLVHGTQLNTYALMDCCQFALTINSQSGLEMLSKHRPVIVAGTAFYGNKGFTADVTSREDLPIVIEQLCANPYLGKTQSDLVDLFLYHFIFEYLLPYDCSSRSFGSEATEQIMQALQKHSRPLYVSDQGLPEVSVQISISQRVQDLYLLGMDELNAGRLDNALNAFRKADALVKDHGFPEERIQLVRKQVEVLIAQKKPGEAVSLVRLLSEIDPENLVLGRFEFACLLEKQGDWREALKQFHELIVRCPDHLDAFFHMELNRKKAGYEQDPIETRLILSRISVLSYIRSVFQALRNGNPVDALKRLFVASWFIFRRLRN